MLKIRLKEMRIEKKLTQKKLARISGVGKTTISDIENNVESPTLDTVFKLADALKVSCFDLLYED